MNLDRRIKIIYMVIIPYNKTHLLLKHNVSIHHHHDMSFQAILKLKESGRVKHVGVSNLNAEQLARLSRVGKPACLQVEVHALCQQKALVSAASALAVPVVAYSPLGSKALADALAAKTG